MFLGKRGRLWVWISGSFLFDKILSCDVNTLLEEYPEIEEKRKYLEKNKKDLQEIKKLIENIF